MAMKTEIETRLQTAFAPRELVVIDESEQHRGHSGFQEGGESHWQVTIASDAFAGMSRIARHRAVHDALGPEVIGRIHALGLTISD
jgi:BolA protein